MKHILGCGAKYNITLNQLDLETYQLKSIRHGDITHLKFKPCYSQIKQPERDELAKRMIKENLTGHEIEKETFKK